MTTITEYINSAKAMKEMVIGTAARETAKAIAFRIGGEKQLAWFPKSRAVFLKDDFYNEPQDKWAVPAWMVQRKAAELGIMPHWIGG